MERTTAMKATTAMKTEPGGDLVDALRTTMLYKQWADRELLDVVERLPWLARVTVGRVIAAVVRHFHAVDCIFRGHLLGIPHGVTSANPSEPSDITELSARVREIDAWYVEYANDLDASAREILLVTFTDGDRQRLSRSEILLHVALHGAYHRGNVGILLRLCGVRGLPDRLTSYLRQPEAALLRG